MPPHDPPPPGSPTPTGAAPPAGGSAARADAVTRRFDSASGPVVAVDRVDVQVPRHQLTVIAGPSGLGEVHLARPPGLHGPARRGPGLAGRSGAHRPQPPPSTSAAPSPGRHRPAATQRQPARPPRCRRQPGLVGPPAGCRRSVVRRRSGSSCWTPSAWPTSRRGGCASSRAASSSACALACAIVGDPLLVVADEPTASLDRASADQVVEVLRAAADRGVTLVVAGHDRRVIEAADHVVELDHGRRVDDRRHRTARRRRRPGPGRRQALGCSERAGAADVRGR